MKLSYYVTAALCISFILFTVFIGVFVDSQYVVGAGADNQNVTVLLNVTNTEPTVYDVIFDDLIASPADQIVLTAGDVTEVLCNASASDPNGQADLINATASIYTTAAGYAAPDLKFNHYTNNTCTEFLNVAGTTNNRTLTCRFLVEYFAHNTTWECNITVRDFGGTQRDADKLFLNDSGTDQALVNELIAINLTSTTLDYGNLSVTQTSGEENINITNAGNIITNFTVLGYGGDNQSVSNAGNSSMLCETNNITIGNHRYSNISGEAWVDMLNLTWNATVVRNVTLNNRTDDNDPLADLAMNTTYWRIRIPLGVVGLCNGTVQFAATNDAA